MMRVPAFPASRRARRALPVALALAALLAASLAVLPASASQPAAGAPSPNASASRFPNCFFAPLHLNRVRAPFQVDLQATYLFFIYKPAKANNVVYKITGEFAHARFQNFLSYTPDGRPTGGWLDTAIKPDDGSLNPFIAGQQVFGKPRHFTIMLVPDTGKWIAANGASPDLVKNVAQITLPQPGQPPVSTSALRIYKPFKNYGRFGGSFPQVQAYQLTPQGTIGKPAKCHSLGGTALITRAFFKAQHQTPPLPPPRPRPKLVQFFRPPTILTPAPDVLDPSSFNLRGCAGYLIGQVKPDSKFALIHMNAFPSFWDSSQVTRSTLMPDPSTYDVRYWSIEANGQTFVGQRGQIYDELTKGNLVRGGLTILAYPNRTGPRTRRMIERYAAAQGWMTMRQSSGPFPNGYFPRQSFLTVRNKVPSSGWEGSIGNVPCWTEARTRPDATPDQIKAAAQRWDNAGVRFASQPRYQGDFSIQGVVCGGWDAVASGRCRRDYHGAYGVWIPRV